MRLAAETGIQNPDAFSRQYLLLIGGAMYELVLTREAQEFYEEADITLAERLNRCFDRLRERLLEN